MEPARPLRDVFADLAGGRGYGASSGMAPEEVLAAHGHPDLPEGLVAEAVVTYADTAPYEVAEHLAPYVRAHTAVPQPAGTDEPEPHWYELLTTAPAGPGLDGPDVIDAEASGLTARDDASSDVDASTTPAGTDIDTDFGYGHRGPVEDAPAAEPVEDTTLTWPADATVDPADLDADAGIDLRLADEGLADEGMVPGDESPDTVDGG